MKRSFFFVAIIVVANTFAAQMPPKPSTTGQAPGQTSEPAPLSNTELSRLLRAQTAAIQALFTKLEEQEERLDAQEKRILELGKANH